MNKLKDFLIDFHYSLEENGYETCVMTQSELKHKIINNGYEICFPMISNEQSCDCVNIVDIDESLFLNQSDYNSQWVCIYKDDEILSCICIQNSNDDENIDIAVFEINVNFRQQGYAKSLFNIFENCAYEYYNKICLTPFDSDASSFWVHMGFNDEGYLLVKEL